MIEPAFRVESFSSQEHGALRKGFSTSSPELDQYLKTHARRDMARDVTTVWILRDLVENQIAGYYTLNSYSVRLTALPDAVKAQLPRYEQIPVVLLGRLAVATRYQHRGLGGALLVNALKRAHQGSRQIGAMGVLVHAKDEKAARFYVRYGFVRLADNPLHLVLAMGTIARL